MRKTLTILLALAAVSAAQTYTMSCKHDDGQTYTQKAVWELKGKAYNVAYFNGYLYEMKSECSFTYNGAYTKPIEGGFNGIITFPAQGTPSDTTRSHGEFDMMSTTIGFPAMRIKKSVRDKEVYSRGDISRDAKGRINGVNIDHTHWVTPAFAFNSVLYPQAMRSDAVSVCGEGWVRKDGSANRMGGAKCIPRGGDYSRLYAIAVGAGDTMLLLDYGTYESHEQGIVGMPIVNEYGEFMGFSN